MRRLLPLLPERTNVVRGAADPLLLALLLALSRPAGAQTPPMSPPPAEKGFEIAARADRTDRGFGDSSVELEMVLRDDAGREARRTLTIRTLEADHEDLGDKCLIVFLAPRDIQGTRLLSHARTIDPDDQWLYLPALKRTKPISAVNRSGPFVGSEFAFEDLTAHELNKFTYEFLREEELEGLRCDVVERKPRYEYSGYMKQIVWIDQRDFQPRKVEFYDRRGELLKTLTLRDYEQYGDYWRSHHARMVNHATGKSTDLIFGEYEFNLGLTEDDFARP